MARRTSYRYGPHGSPERVGASMRASSKLPAQERPTFYKAPGLRATREAAGLTREQLAEKAGYSSSIVAELENGGSAHSVTISRLSAACGEHDLRVVRGEGPGPEQASVTRTGDVLIPGETTNREDS